MLDSTLRWLVAVAVWIIRQSQGMQLERTMASEELRQGASTLYQSAVPLGIVWIHLHVMGRPDPLALE